MRSAEPRPTIGAWLSLVVVAGSVALSVMSTNGTNLALPGLGAELGASAVELQAVVAVFVVTLAATMLFGGWVADRVGHKRIFLLGAGVFALGSLICGFATGMPMLLAGRVIQAIGPALIMPSSLGQLGVAFPAPGWRAFAIGLWSATSGIATALGPTLGGLLIQVGGWRSIFWAVAVLTLILGLLGWIILRPGAPGPPRTLDLPGGLLGGGTLAAIVVFVLLAQELGPSAPPAVGIAVAALALLIGFVLRERAAADPMVDLPLLREPRFLAGLIGGFTTFFAFVGCMVYLSIYGQTVLGRAPGEVGLALSATGIAMALTSPVVGMIMRRTDPARPLTVGLFVTGIGMLLLTRLGTDTPLWEMGLYLIVVGIGIGGTLAPVTALALGAVPPSRTGMVSALSNVAKQFGQAIGVAIMGSVIFYGISDTAQIGRDPEVRDAFLDGLHRALLLAGSALLAGAVAVFVLSWRRSSRPDEVIDTKADIS